MGVKIGEIGVKVGESLALGGDLWPFDATFGDSWRVFWIFGRFDAILGRSVEVGVGVFYVNADGLRGEGRGV